MEAYYEKTSPYETLVFSLGSAPFFWPTQKRVGEQIILHTGHLLSATNDILYADASRTLLVVGRPSVGEGTES